MSHSASSLLRPEVRRTADGRHRPFAARLDEGADHAVATLRGPEDSDTPLLEPLPREPRGVVVAALPDEPRGGAELAAQAATLAAWPPGATPDLRVRVTSDRQRRQRAGRRRRA